jgi:glucosamine kinase
VGPGNPLADLFLGVDGGGTRCRARLADRSGHILGEGIGGPANIRLGLDAAFASVIDAARQCLAEAGLGDDALARTTACLALAGATEPRELAAARSRHLPFRHTTITSDAHAACIGAHGGQDGGVIVVGTGSVGWAILGGRQYRVGGWGLPLSDEGSAAWLGREALRQALRAHDGRAAATALLRHLLNRFGGDPYAIVRWADTAAPAEYGRLAPLVVEHAAQDDAAAVDLIERAAHHIDGLAARLIALGIERLALAGGLAPHLEAWLGPPTRQHLVPPQGDALAGALELARSAQSSHAESDAGVEA